MNRSHASVIVLFLVIAVAVAGVLRPARDEDARGLTIFKKSGCNECHVISALGVEKETKKKTDEPAAADADSKKKKKDPPDLSGVGLEHEAKWISAYLNKEEAKDGEKHEKRFKGSEADRRTLAMWLASLKTEVKKAPAGEKPAAEEKPTGDSKTDG